MRPSGHRAIRTLAVFLVLALGVAALLPLTVRGATNEVNGLVSTCGPTTPYVAGATVTLVDANGINAPATATTDGGGKYEFISPATGSYTISVTASGYYPASTSTPVRYDGTLTATINLVATPRLFGHVQDSSGFFLDKGVVAWLYNPSAPNSSAYRLIPAIVSNSFFDFHGTAGPYTLIVDANGYLSHEEPITLGTTPNPHDVKLNAAPAELYQTIAAYGPNDWSNLTVWRNLTLNPDSTLPGLGPANLRDLRLQIDATLGNGGGSLSAGEIAAFCCTPTSWLARKGPGYVTTDGFLTTNGRSSNSSLASFNVAVRPTLSTPDAKVGVTTTTTYRLKQTPPWIATGAKNYFVNMTMVPDTNVSVYQNYTYSVILPKRYELNTTKLVPFNAPVTTTNFTTVIIDPRVTSGTPQIQMRISQSINGTARAKVDNPVGKFYVKNVTFTNYQAFVAGNTTLVFSANDSYDPNGPLANANFTC